jgi:hypothetical protein
MSDLNYAEPVAPPSVLPDISPTRGRLAVINDFANLQRR